MVQQKVYSALSELLPDDGVTIVLDSTSEMGGDTKPFAILVVTSRHVYLVDVLFLDESNAATCGPEVQKFVIDYLPSLRDHVVAVSTDNHPGMAQVFADHLKPLLPHAHHQRCVGHVLNLVGGDLLGAEILSDVKELQKLVRSFLKGKKNVARRRRLKKLGHGVPPVPCATRWNSWYVNAVWLNANLATLRAFVNMEIRNGATNVQMVQVKEMLDEHFSTLTVKLAFIVHRGKPVFDLIHDVQVAVAPKASDEHGARRPQMHRVYNQLKKLHAQLSDTSSFGAFVDDVFKALSSKDREPYKKGFIIATHAAAAKVQKYLALLPFAKHARVLDPRQRPVLESEDGMGTNIVVHKCLFRTGEVTPALQVEWDAYWKLPPVVATDRFSILDWWEGVSPTLPMLSGIARRVLAVPATSCDVERCFSALKWVRDERQQDMKEDTHRAAVLLHFNGIVN